MQQDRAGLVHTGYGSPTYVCPWRKPAPTVDAMAHATPRDDDDSVMQHRARGAVTLTPTASASSEVRVAKASWWRSTLHRQLFDASIGVVVDNSIHTRRWRRRPEAALELDALGGTS